jgi:hypothetical protein
MTMSLSEIVMEGTLKPDGTLELDHKPNLAPGRVTVVLRQEFEAIPPPQEDWWEFMRRARRELEASGAKFMNEEQVSAHIEWLREGDRIDDLLREASEQRAKPEQP